MSPKRSRKENRRGTTVVETAAILPVFVFFLLGVFEFAHAQMVSNMLQASCRSAARYGSTEEVTTDNVEQYLLHMMAPAASSDKIVVLIRDAGVYDTGGDLPSTTGDFANMPTIDLNDTEPRQLFVIRATVSYNDVALVGLPFFENIELTGTAFMRHE